jgi:uncharacterized membrane protein
MRRLTLAGVPLHPALVHVPITLWLFVPALDGVYLYTQRSGYWLIGWWCAVVGVLVALPAMLAGALDAFVSRGLVEAEVTVWRHAGLMSVSWTFFAVASLLSRPDGPPRAPVLVLVALHLLGFIAVLVGAHAGGQLAYVYRLPASSGKSASPR